MKRRNLKLGPSGVECKQYQGKLVAKFSGYSGNTEWRAEVELDLSDATYLIHELRMGMRKVRDFAIESVNAAEGPL